MGLIFYYGDFSLLNPFIFYVLVLLLKTSLLFPFVYWKWETDYTFLSDEWMFEYLEGVVLFDDPLLRDEFVS